MTQDNLQFVSFFLALIKKLVVEQPKHYGQRGENVLKVGIYAQKGNIEIFLFTYKIEGI